MKLSHSWQTLFFAGMIAMTIAPVANAATYYVNRGHASANDLNPGTATQPFRTISRAARTARAGDSVIVMSGTYPEYVEIANSGTVAQPISFIANGKVVVTAPTTTSPAGLFNVLGKSDIVISGFNVERARYGIKVDKGRNGVPSERVTLKNNHATLTKSSGIRVAFSRNIIVDSNVVEKTNWGGVHEMISVINTDGFVLKNNEVFNGVFVMNGRTIEGKEGIDVKDGSRNGQVINNKVHDLHRLGIYVDAWDSPTYDIEISGNVVYNCKQGIALASEAGGLLKDILVANNVTYNNLFSGITVPSWAHNGRRENIRIVNNTVHSNAKGGITISTSNITRVDIHNNLISSNGGPALYAANARLITTSYNNLVSGRSLGNIVNGTFNGDPRFVSATTGNFRLGTGSAAINKGRTISDVPTDIAGTLRPRGGAYDVGAFESN